MKKKYKHSNYFRRIKTTQEHRANGKRSDEHYRWARAKRCGKNLPNSWDDITTRPQKTWKVKRRNQHRDKHRGRKHSMKFETWVDLWKLENYLDEHEIPYCIEDLKETRSIPYNVTIVINTDTIAKYTFEWDKKTNKRVKGHQIGWEHIWQRVETGEVKYRTYSVIVGYEVTWWANKDIGIDYIIG